MQTRARSSAGRRQAFTRLELLVVVVTLALLAVVSRPTLGVSSSSKTMLCMDNLRRLSCAWLMFAHDNDGLLVSNTNEGGTPVPSRSPWVSGWLDWTTNPDNTNRAYLTDARYALLAPYAGPDASYYRCPTDEYLSPVQIARGWVARSRSYSMNASMGTSVNDTFFPNYQSYLRLSDLRHLAPSQAFVFTEEHPDSINDGVLIVNLTSWAWTDLPAAFHEQACWFTFADGHLEMKTWQSASTLLPVRSGLFNPGAVRPNDPDLAWLRARASERK